MLDHEEVGAYEAKTNFGQLLDRVEKGECIVITRRGKTVAQLVPSHLDVVDRVAAREAAERMIKRAQKYTLGGIKIKDLITEGRKW